MHDSPVLERVAEALPEKEVFAVREGVRGDAAAVSRLLEESWLHAARRGGPAEGRVSAAQVRAHFADGAAERWLTHWFGSGAGSLVQRVAVRAGEVVGFLAVTRRLRADELAVACVRPQERGLGAGYAMFRDATGLLVDRSRPLVADYPAQDAAMRATLGKWGFVPEAEGREPGRCRFFPSADFPQERAVWDPVSSRRDG